MWVQQAALVGCIITVLFAIYGLPNTNDIVVDNEQQREKKQLRSNLTRGMELLSPTINDLLQPPICKPATK